MPNRRHVYMVLSPRSLSYSRGALESLFRNSIEPIQLRLIIDSKQDKEENCHQQRDTPGAPCGYRGRSLASFCGSGLAGLASG